MEFILLNLNFWTLLSEIISPMLSLYQGCARSIIVAERVVLNFMQRMSGIATLTKVISARTYMIKLLLGWTGMFLLVCPRLLEPCLCYSLKSHSMCSSILFLYVQHICNIKFPAIWKLPAINGFLLSRDLHLTLLLFWLPQAHNSWQMLVLHILYFTVLLSF